MMPKPAKDSHFRTGSRSPATASAAPATASLTGDITTGARLGLGVNGEGWSSNGGAESAARDGLAVSVGSESNSLRSCSISCSYRSFIAARPSRGEHPGLIRIRIITAARRRRNRSVVAFRFRWFENVGAPLVGALLCRNRYEPGQPQGLPLHPDHLICNATPGRPHVDNCPR